MLTDSTFTIADFKGSSITLEYFEPYDILTPGKLVIGMVGKASGI